MTTNTILWYYNKLSEDQRKKAFIDLVKIAEKEGHVICDELFGKVLWNTTETRKPIGE